MNWRSHSTGFKYANMHGQTFIFGCFIAFKKSKGLKKDCTILRLKKIARVSLFFKLGVNFYLLKIVEAVVAGKYRSYDNLCWVYFFLKKGNWSLQWLWMQKEALSGENNSKLPSVEQSLTTKNNLNNFPAHPSRRW